MIRFCLIFLFLFSVTMSGQEPESGYHLIPGNRYSLHIDVRQNTFSESYGQGNDVSLDLNMTIHFDVESQLNNEFYTAQVSYENLFLSMLAPGMNIDINSANGTNSILPTLIDSLESKYFRAQISRDGTVIMFGDINGFFFKMYDYVINSEEEQDVIIKTLREAFGNNAFNSFCNLFINIYPSSGTDPAWDKEFLYYFNTKPVEMKNRFFLVKQTEKQNTIQGMGMISTLESVVETHNGSSVQSTATGSQTYDLQLDPATGWLLKGSSRQRILVKTIILQDSKLPRGLEIPSYTETTFTIKGTVTK